MPTFFQLQKNPRSRKKHKSRAPSLGQCPQKKGICTRVLLLSPKKPNSANRRIVKVLIGGKKRLIAHVPGIGHNLQKHGNVLIRGGRVRDLPGVKYRVIRGKFDLACIISRRQGRSKYGMKKV
jgi:small subunit ribosomal protein S12